jgi:nicotinic acid mononucleotide adenylyltransferase
MSTTTPPLQEVAQRLVNMAEETKPLVCLAIAGGGAHAIATLAATPGASSVLLEGTLTYDRSSFHSYVQQQQQQQRLRRPDDNSGGGGDFKYVSSEAAHLLSKAALERALRYRPKQQSHCVGVGASSALASSKPNRLSRGHIVATHSDGRQWECYIQLASNKRTRLEEDEVLSRLILESMEQVVSGSSNNNNNVDPVVLDNAFAEDELQQWFSPGVIVPAEDAVRVGAERVLRGDAPAVLLLPRADGTPFFFATPSRAVLPNRSLVVPGSFNPPHVGHAALANAAKSVYAATTTNNNNNDKEEDVDPSVFFELSMMNADKPPLTPATVVERAHAFFQLDDDGLLPTHWGILLTSAPLFSQKADILRDCIADFTTSSSSSSRSPQMAFCIGTDTMVRILNPKYYGGSKEDMLKAVRDMKGVHFCVGGRLQQAPGGDGDEKFVTGQEELADLPRDVQDMFSLVNDFRVDISSTELRKQKGASLPSSSSS